MKKIKIFIALLTLCNVVVKAQIPGKKIVVQPNVQIHIAKVSSVVLVIDSAIHQPNSSSYRNFIKAAIASNGAALVTYKWILKSSNPNAPITTIPGSLTLSGSGTDYIYIEKISGSETPAYSVRLQTDTPNQVMSNKIDLN